MDAQTRVEHTLALAALTQAMVKELSEHFEAGKQLARYPYEMLDENKWLAARHGMEGELVDLPERRTGPGQGAGASGSTTGCGARAGPRIGRRARGDRGHPATTGTARSGSAWSTRRTTTTARSCREIVGGDERAA